MRSVMQESVLEGYRPARSGEQIRNSQAAERSSAAQESAGHRANQTVLAMYGRSCCQHFPVECSLIENSWP